VAALLTHPGLQVIEPAAKVAAVLGALPSKRRACWRGEETEVWRPSHNEDPLYVYRLLKPLYSMPSAVRAWHTTMSAFLSKEGCATVGFEKSMWTVTIDGTRILLGTHIDDFVIACANRQVFDGFCDAF